MKSILDWAKKFFGDSLGKSLTAIFTPILTAAIAGVLNAPWYWIVLTAIGGTGVAVGIMVWIEESRRVSIDQRNRHLRLQAYLQQLLDEAPLEGGLDDADDWLRVVESALACLKKNVSDRFYQEYISRLPHDPYDQILKRAFGFLRSTIAVIRDEDIGFEPPSGKSAKLSDDDEFNF
jgi:hypothetical protein